MDYGRFVDGQRRAVNGVFFLLVAVLALMWIATAADAMFDLGWGWDSQILWLAPLMAVFAAFVRFCAMTIFKFVGRGS